MLQTSYNVQPWYKVAAGAPGVVLNMAHWPSLMQHWKKKVRPNIHDWYSSSSNKACVAIAMCTKLHDWQNGATANHKAHNLNRGVIASSDGDSIVIRITL